MLRVIGTLLIFWFTLLALLAAESASEKAEDASKGKDTHVCISTDGEASVCLENEAFDNLAGEQKEPSFDFWSLFGKKDTASSLSADTTGERPQEASFATQSDHSDVKDESLANILNLLFSYSKTLDQNIESLKDKLLASVTADLDKAHAGIELYQLFKNSTDHVKEQLNQHFGGIGLEYFNAVQFYYYMLHEESRRDSVWKRQKHRFMPPLPLEEAKQFADANFLCQLAYADTCQEIEHHLKTFQNDTWVLRNCTTKALPFKPASYLILPRDSLTEEDENASSNEQDDDFIEAVLVVRATKEYSDILSDALLEPVEYRGGKTHEGMLESGRWLSETYKDDLLQIVKDSNRSKLKLYAIGHSLGGGAAQMVTTFLNDYEELDAHAIGFGAPALFTANLSASVKDSITSVIVDADCVARMSGASVANAWLKIFAFNFTKPALDDLEQLFPLLLEKVAPYGSPALNLLNWLKSEVEATIVAGYEKQLEAREAIGQGPRGHELFPAGDCVHFYRDGSAWQAVYMPCTRLDEMEVVKLMVNDHMTSTGYYPSLLNYMRDLQNDHHYKFEHDSVDLPFGV